MISCAKTSLPVESSVPEIINVYASADSHSAVLTSNLKNSPKGKVQCGFYVGQTEQELSRMTGILKNDIFTLTLEGLQASTRFYYQAFISNGKNMILSERHTFVTDQILPDNNDESTNPQEPINPSDPYEPDDTDNPVTPEDSNDIGGSEGTITPDEPEESPGDEYENPEDEYENPEDEYENPEAEPEIPVVFTTEITSTSASISDNIAVFVAELDGNISIVTEGWFMAGYEAEKLTKIKGAIEGIALKAYLAGLESGCTIWYKAMITNGKESKESGLNSLYIP